MQSVVAAVAYTRARYPPCRPTNIGVARGQMGAIAAHKMHKNTFLIQNCAIFLNILQRTLLRRLTAIIHGSEVPPSPSLGRVPPPRKIPGLYAYGQPTTSKHWMYSRMGSEFSLVAISQNIALINVIVVDDGMAVP